MNERDFTCKQLEAAIRAQRPRKAATRAPATHTPGPWMFNSANQLTAGARGVHLGTFSEAVGMGAAAEANKRLIEAAPALLAACKQLADADQMDNATVDRAVQAAIRAYAYATKQS